MDLSGLPQLSVMEIEPGPTPVEARILGRLSHLRGVRNRRGWLYRPDAVSIVGDLEIVPSSPDEVVAFVTPDASLAPELCVGAVFAWLDGYWEPRHITMVLAAVERWQRKSVVPKAARYLKQDGLTFSQAADAPVPEGAVDIGLRAGGWDHEHCELCLGRIGALGAADGYADPDDCWLCIDCYERYASRQDVSFATET